jgi:hypothetical protein
MIPWPSWAEVCRKLEPHGIELKWVDLSGTTGETGCYLIREDTQKSTTYPVDLSPNHDLNNIKVPPSQLGSICRRFKLDPSVLDVGLD